jgi:hypothetical protein
MRAMGDPGVGGERPTEAMEKAPQGQGQTWSEKVKTIGGLLAVTVGVIAVGTIAVVALAKGTSTAATIASSSAGVIATVVGAYFGVKVGSDQSKAAADNQRAEAAKAQVYAAHLPADEAPSIIEKAEAAARDAVAR